jgi:membrane protein implicated in regulation of membrane protease activity
MTRRSLLEAIKRVDALVVLLIAILAALAIGAVYAALYLGWFGSPWQLATWLVICVAFLAAGVPAVGHRMTRHTNVHGSARPASQDEARKAALGDAGPSPMHDQTFKD